MNAPFSCQVPTQVLFGDGVVARLPDVLPANACRVALLRGASGVAAAPVRNLIETAGFAVTEIFCTKEPTVASVNAALAELDGAQIDAIVACGGGSVIDAGKAIAFCLGNATRLTDTFSDINPEQLNKATGLPLVAIPTTAGTGAEVTRNAVLGVPSLDAKLSLRGVALYPTHALVDPSVLKTVPKSARLASGLDAIVQTIEAYTSNAATPFSDALTEPNIARGLEALNQLMRADDAAAWRDLAWTSVSSGMALANSGLGAAHGIASVIGGQFDAPHGALCGRLLVPVLRENLARCEPGSDIERKLIQCRDAISRVFPTDPSSDAFAGLEAWQSAEGLPVLRDFGVTTSMIPSLAERSSKASSSQKNGVALEVSSYERILSDAF